LSGLEKLVGLPDNVIMLCFLSPRWQEISRKSRVLQLIQACDEYADTDSVKVLIIPSLYGLQAGNVVCCDKAVEILWSFQG
jgi:hypothetical protein